MKSPSIDDAIKAMAAQRNGRGRHKGEIRIWLETHRDQLAATTLNFKALAEYLGSQGIRDNTGKPPTPAAVFSAWNRMRNNRHSAPQTSERIPVPLAQAFAPLKKDKK